MMQLFQELMSNEDGYILLPASLGIWGPKVAAATSTSSSILTSLQPFEITIAATATNNTATITAVDTSRSFIVFGGTAFDNASSAQNNSRARVELTNSSTVTARRSGTTGNLTARGTVVQLTASAITSVQFGTTAIAISATSNTTAITSVDTSRSAVFHLGVAATAGTLSTAAYYHATAHLSDSSTISVRRDDTAASVAIEVGWVVVQFASGIATTEQRVVTTTAATLTTTDTITTISTSRTMLAYGGERGISTTEQDFLYNRELTDASTVTYTRRGTGTSTGTRTLVTTAIQFGTGYISNLQRDTGFIDGTATSQDVTISSVTTASSLTTFLGMASDGDQPNEQDCTVKLLDTTNIRIQKGAAGASTDDCDVGWEVISFS